MAELEACRVTDQAVVVGLYPDVCLTPPNNAPVPYAVIARFSDGVRARATVRFRGLDAMTDFGRISRVYGDEAGLGGGVRSGVNMGMCRPKVASSSVRINGQYVVRHTDEIEMNCAGPEGPSNTTGKVMYVPVGTPLAVGPMGEVAGDTDPPVEPETEEEIGFLGQVGGFFKGMKDGAVDAAVGVKDLAVGGFWVSDVGQFVNPERSDQARETLRTTAGAIWDDPGLVWDGIKEPYVEAWGRGAYGEAIGRGTLEAVLAVVGTKGVDKAAKGATAASRAAGAADDVARLADDVARLGDDAARAATASADDAARAAASAADDAARAGTDGIQVLGESADDAARQADDLAKLRASERPVEGSTSRAARKGSGEPVTRAELRNPKPNSTYSVNGYVYKTDSRGRVTQASGSLKLKTGTRVPSQQSAVGKSGVPRPEGYVYGVSDDGGHLVGTRFDGAGEAINMVPQNSALNQNGLWKELEDGWADALKHEQSVHVEVQPVYSGTSARPTEFNIRQTIGGETSTATIQNTRTGR